VAIDMKRLRTDIKAQAAECSHEKKTYREAQRALSIFQRDTKNYTYPQIRALMDPVDGARSKSGYAAEMMTKLCVFKAHLRGRKHLTENSVWADQVDGWIATLEDRYALPDKPAEAA